MSLLLAVALGFPLSVVEVTAEDGSPARRVWLKDVVDVTISYVHSVERTPVEESFQANGGGLRLYEVRWQSSGAGLPEEYDDCEDGFYVRRMDVGFGRRLDYWFLPLNEVRIAVDALEVFTGPNEPALVTLRIRRVPVVALGLWRLSAAV